MSATGTLSAVTTVQVGTQVSGKIVELMVDFNDRVRKGSSSRGSIPRSPSRPCAMRRLGGAQHRGARATGSRVQAQRAVVPAQGAHGSRIQQREVSAGSCEGQREGSQVALDRARQNLAYTQIYAPIDGIIVERTVELGQTVVASMSTPQLFLIANDLSQMQILASVDEATSAPSQTDRTSALLYRPAPTGSRCSRSWSTCSRNAIEALRDQPRAKRRISITSRRIDDGDGRDRDERQRPEHPGRRFSTISTRRFSTTKPDSAGTRRPVDLPPDRRGAWRQAGRREPGRRRR